MELPADFLSLGRWSVIIIRGANETRQLASYSYSTRSKLELELELDSKC